MNIIVCIKQVPDPEIPPIRFQIDTERKKIIPPDGVAPVISVFDERAVEAALQLKDDYKARVTALTLGPESAKAVIRHALAMGVDAGVHVQYDAAEDLDSFGISHLLVKAIEKIGEYSVVLCGRQAADWDAGQVGSIMAENLGIPVVPVARKVDWINGKLRVESVIQDGYRVIDSPVPALVTVSSEIGLARLPSGLGIVKAARVKIENWSIADIGADIPETKSSEILKLYIPVREVECRIIEADTIPEAAQELGLRLREAKII